MSSYEHIYKRIEDHIREMFRLHHPPQLVFHNLHHTEEVVRHVSEIAGHYHLSEDDMLIVYTGAWFHDVGYLFTDHKEHEEKGVALMRSFMEEFDLPDEVTDKIASSIMATKMPRNPQNLLEEILCDADTYQFGSKKEFKKTNELVFEEFYNCNHSLTRSKFYEGALEMFKGHQFYTSYCRDLLENDKKKNMKKLKEKIKKSDKQESEISEITEKDGTTKGMQTMLRLTSSNHINLSEMADHKANILLSVNAIIISVILSVLLRKLQTDPYLTIPTLIFLSFSVVTIVIAILSTRPKVNEGRFADEDIVNKKTNLLFFGNFHKMSAIDYENAMRSMMKDSDYLYSSMIQDIFHLGQVLGKKYRLIRIAYNVFMIGIIASVIAFTIATMFHTSSPDAIQNNSGSPF